MSWPLVELGEEVNVLAGNAWRSSFFSEDPSSGPPLIRIQNVTDGESGFVYWSKEYDQKYLVNNGDILLSLSGNVKLCEWSRGRALLNQRVVKLTPSDNLDKRYIYWAINRVLVELEALAKRAVIANVSISDLKSFKVPLPPLKEQQRIAAILDKADAIRRKRQQAIALADEFLRAVFLEMFGDPVSNPMNLRVERLDSISSFVAGSTLPSTESFIGQTEGVAAFKVGDMNAPGNEYYLVSPREWAINYKKSNAFVPPGTIIFPKRGGAIGTNKKRITSSDAVLDPNLMGVVPDEGIPLEYLFFWFQLLDLTSISSGSSVPQLNKKDLAPLKVIVPSKTALDKFVNVSRALRSNKGLQEISERASCDLFHSLSQKAFSGEL